MTDIGKCPAFGYDCEYVSKVEAQAAEIERLEREVEKQRSLRDQYRAAWEAEKARTALGETE